MLLLLSQTHTLFRSAVFLLFSGCFLPPIITIKPCPSFSICGNFPMAIPQPTWVSPKHTQHSLFDGGFHCFQGRRYILLELRPCSMRFSFHKVCSCLNRHTGRQLLALSNLTQPRSGIVCQFCADNEYSKTAGLKYWVMQIGFWPLSPVRYIAWGYVWFKWYY